MDFLVRIAEGNLSQRDMEYAAKKLDKLSRFFHQAHKVEIVHREEKLSHRIEITVFADHFTIRGEEEDQSVRAAVDKLSDKLENRLRKLKGRLIRNHRRRGSEVPPGIAEVDHETDDSVHIEIKERKVFVLKPMSPDEAALQLEMIDYPFYMFRNEDTGQVEAIYRRKDGRFGLLQPEG